ncbi:DMT family transporter [Neisseriaceae bacterium CLB008]|nr:DMT family transporter [Neisseriaceae bacterium]
MSQNKHIPSSASGWLNGFIGMLIFSGSLPATRVAVLAFDPVFLTAARASIAGGVALLLLLKLKQSWPSANQIGPLIIVSIGVVIGFPLLTALALQHVTSAHSIVFLGLLPLTTATFGVIRGGERPRPAFWGFSIVGSLLVMGFALSQGGSASLVGDLLMLAAVVICGLGYAEGAKLSRSMGGWQVICWALVLSLPLMIMMAWLLQPETVAQVDLAAWLGLAYVSLFSMLIGFFFWYKGLAQGGIAAVGQLQLLQPFFGLALAAWLLHEAVSPTMLFTTLGVILCVAGSKRFGR